MKNVVVRLLFVVALPTLASCSPSVQPIDVRPGCPEMPLRGPEEFASAPLDNLIDDFEDDSLALPLLGGRTGYWVGSLGPLPVPGAMVVGGPSSDCVARGTRSGHAKSTGITTLYAASCTAIMMDQTLAPTSFDASAYSGFSFWIARGDDAAQPYEIPIGVTTADTAVAFGICYPCNDYYALHRRIPLTKTWTRWVVQFSELSQSGVGNPQVPLRRDKMVGIIIWPEHQFDIWLDDFRFEP